MWEIVYWEKYNYFDVVVTQLATAPIFKLYARRLGTGHYCPIFMLSSTKAFGRRVSYGGYDLALEVFRMELDRYPAPLSLYTGKTPVEIPYFSEVWV